MAEIKNRNQEYWNKRFEEISERNAKIGDMSEKDLVKLYRDTFNEMDNEVQSFYSKYGRIQSSPTFKVLPDGTKVMTGTSSKLVVPVNEANKALSKGTRLSKLQQQLSAILFKMSKEQKDIMDIALINTATGMYYDTIYEIQKGVGVGTSFNLLTEPQVESLIRNEVNGQSFSTRVWNNRSKLENTVNQTLKAGITQGLSNGQMAKRIKENMNTGSYVANRLLRTEVTNTYNQASLLGYDRSGIVTQYQYIATLDNRTSDVCTDLDGQVFKTEEATTGLNFPPMHVNCRSTTSAYLGERTAQTRIARDLETKNTYIVPADMNAKNWRAIYVDKTMTRKQWDKGKRAK